MDKQQQLMENLTHAIHGLVEVLAQTQSSSSVDSQTSSQRVGQSQLSEKSQKTTSRTSDDSSTTSNQSSSRKRRSSASRHKVNQYIDAIMAYNDVPLRPHTDKWLITIAALKRLTHCGQSVIYDVLSDRESEIQFHHDQHQLGIFHNQKGRNAQPIESLICLD